MSDIPTLLAGVPDEFKLIAPIGIGSLCWLGWCCSTAPVYTVSYSAKAQRTAPAFGAAKRYRRCVPVRLVRLPYALPAYPGDLALGDSP
jgi:hypothetical protein